MPFSDQRIPAPFILLWIKTLLEASTAPLPIGIPRVRTSAYRMRCWCFRKKLSTREMGLPAGMLFRQAPQRADDLADAVLPFLQGFPEFLEPVPRLQRSLPVGGVQRLFQMLQGVPAVQHLGRAWKGFLAEAPHVPFLLL